MALRTTQRCVTAALHRIGGHRALRTTRTTTWRSQCNGMEAPRTPSCCSSRTLASSPNRLLGTSTERCVSTTIKRASWWASYLYGATAATRLCICPFASAAAPPTTAHPPACSARKVQSPPVKQSQPRADTEGALPGRLGSCMRRSSATYTHKVQLLGTELGYNCDQLILRLYCD